MIHHKQFLLGSLDVDSCVKYIPLAPKHTKIRPLHWTLRSVCPLSGQIPQTEQCLYTAGSNTDWLYHHISKAGCWVLENTVPLASLTSTPSAGSRATIPEAMPDPHRPQIVHTYHARNHATWSIYLYHTKSCMTTQTIHQTQVYIIDYRHTIYMQCTNTHA